MVLDKKVKKKRIIKVKNIEKRYNKVFRWKLSILIKR